MPLHGVDADMLTATSDYFSKLLRNLDRQIEQAGSRSGDNARKTDRDQFWSELLAIWCELGGKPTGAAAADFLIGRVEAGDGAQSPSINVDRAMAGRRQNKTVSKVSRCLRRRATR